MNSEIVTWYGLDSVIGDIEYIHKTERPNGSHRYYLNQDKIRDLPASDVPIIINYIPKNWPESAKLTKNIKKSLNRLLLPLNPYIDIIDDVILKDGNYYAIYSDGGPVTLAARTLERIISQFQLINFEKAQRIDTYAKDIQEDEIAINIQESKFDKLDYDTALVARTYSLKKRLSELDPINLSLDQPYLADIDVGNREDLLKIEYRFRVGFEKSIEEDPSLENYANLFTVSDLPANGSLITFPYWDESNLNIYQEYMDLDLPQGVRRATLRADQDYITLSNGLSYQLPFKRNRRDWQINDAQFRLEFVEDEAGLVVTAQPNQFILGSFSPEYARSNIDSIKNDFIRMWNTGEFLSNYGKHKYTDSFSVLLENTLLPTNSEL